MCSCAVVHYLKIYQAIQHAWQVAASTEYLPIAQTNHVIDHWPALICCSFQHERDSNKSDYNILLIFVRIHALLASFICIEYISYMIISAVHCVAPAVANETES